MLPSLLQLRRLHPCLGRVGHNPRLRVLAGDYKLAPEEAVGKRAQVVDKLVAAADIAVAVVDIAVVVAGIADTPVADTY